MNFMLLRDIWSRVLRLCGSRGLGLGVVALLIILNKFIYVCRPNEILIFSGRSHKRPDGTRVGYRVIFGGRAFRIPIVEQVERMEMRAIPIEVAVNNAYTRVGIPLEVRAIAVVKVSSDSNVVMNAIERFLGRDLFEIQRVARETLEGNLRGVLATLTPEEVNEDRLKFASSLSQEVEQDLSKLGLQLDVLKIQSVTDDAKYLDSIGRGQIAEVIKDAEIAESDANNEAAKEKAAAMMRAKVAEAEADRYIAEAENDIRKTVADLESEAKSIEEEAAQAAEAARARALQTLEQVRRELENLRLQSNVVIPAEIAKEVAALDAVGEAASTEENGRQQAPPCV